MTGQAPRASSAEVACCSLGALAVLAFAAVVVLEQVADGARDVAFEDGLVFVFALGAAAVVACVGALGALLALAVHVARHGVVLRPVTWVLGVLPALGGAVFALGLLAG